jgi:hypothetical protein
VRDWLVRGLRPDIWEVLDITKYNLGSFAGWVFDRLSSKALHVEGALSLIPTLAPVSKPWSRV